MNVPSPGAASIGCAAASITPPAPNISGGSHTSRSSRKVPNAPSCATSASPAARAAVRAARVSRLVSPTWAPTMTPIPRARASSISSIARIEAAHFRDAHVDQPSRRRSVEQRQLASPHAAFVQDDRAVHRLRDAGERRVLLSGDRLLDRRRTGSRGCADRRRRLRASGQRLLASARTRNEPSGQLAEDGQLLAVASRSSDSLTLKSRKPSRQ